jgi:hypothetical protein
MGAALIALVAMTGATPYHWPLDLPQQLSSSFAEYRSGRFHAGIDLRTGPIGKAVYAADQGYVARVRCSPYGYGKAIYLKLADGNTAIYAHLDGYYDELAEFVRRAQHGKKSYSVDLYPEPGAFPVTRGMLIARSGQTGIGVPHLHYEIRDSANRPIHPRSLGISWPDNDAPTIRNVILIPLDPNSRVEGGLTPVAMPSPSVGTSTVKLSGRVGIGIDVIDPANQNANKLGVYTVDTRIDGAPLFSLLHDRLSYDTMSDGVVSYYPFERGDGPYLLQFRWPNNRAHVYRHHPGDGVLNVTQDSILSVAVADEAGNADSFALSVVHDPTPTRSGSPASVARVDLTCHGDMLVLTARFVDAESEAPVLRCEGAPLAAGGTFEKTDAYTYQAGIQTEPGTWALTLRVAHPRLEPYDETVAVITRGSGEHTIALGDVRMDIADTSAYGTLFAKVEEIDPPNAPPIPLRGKAYQCWPERSPIDTAVTVALPIPTDVQDPRRASVYRTTGGGWSRMKTTQRKGRYVVSTRSLGTFAVLEDTASPLIRKVTPQDGPTTSRRPAVSARVSETGSGIAGITVTANGQWLLCAYDPEQERIDWERDEDLPVGAVTLTITVTDRAGNTSVYTRNLQVPA